MNATLDLWKSRAQSVAQSNAADREERARQNRQLMPGTAANLDEWRKWFPGAKLTFSQEGERTVGKRGPVGVPVTV